MRRRMGASSFLAACTVLLAATSTHAALLSAGTALHPVRSHRTAPHCCAEDCSAEDDLTLEDLSDHLAGVRAYYRSTKELDPESARINMFAARIDGLRLQRCHLAPSGLPDAGIGLFASRDIRADELITLYPGDALLYWPDGAVKHVGHDASTMTHGPP